MHPFYHILDDNCYLHKNEELLLIQLMEIAICLEFPLTMKDSVFAYNLFHPFPPFAFPLKYNRILFHKKGKFYSSFQFLLLYFLLHL